VSIRITTTGDAGRDPVGGSPEIRALPPSLRGRGRASTWGGRMGGVIISTGLTKDIKKIKRSKRRARYEK
jgi:hypothetical protein